MKELTAQALIVSERDQSAQSGESSPMTLSPDIYKDPLRGISLHSKPLPPPDGNTFAELQEDVHELPEVDNKINSVDGSNAITTVVALQKETVFTEANAVCFRESSLRSLHIFQTPLLAKNLTQRRSYTHISKSQFFLKKKKLI